MCGQFRQLSKELPSTQAEVVINYITIAFSVLTAGGMPEQPERDVTND